MPKSPPPCPRANSGGTPSAEDFSSMMKRSATPTTGDGQPHWLPADPEEQLTVAYRIISAAYKHRQVHHEQEIRLLRQQLDESTKNTIALQKKAQQQDIDLMELRNRLNACKEENLSLTSMLRRLQNRNAHLESIRKAVLNSIQDGTAEDDSLQTMIGAEYLNPLGGSSLHTDFNDISSGDGRNDSLRFNSTGCHQNTMSSPSLNLNSTGNQTVMSSKGHSSSTPEQSQTTSATPSLCLPNSGSGDVNGRTFFRSVRQRVDYDRFQAFIGVVRALNAKQLSRLECLNRAREIFGTEHADLVDEFSKMLAKHTPVAQPEAC